VRTTGRPTARLRPRTGNEDQRGDADRADGNNEPHDVKETIVDVEGLGGQARSEHGQETNEYRRQPRAPPTDLLWRFTHQITVLQARQHKRRRPNGDVVDTRCQVCTDSGIYRSTIAANKNDSRAKPAPQGCGLSPRPSLLAGELRLG
jgi:hypothetical protein